MPRALLHSFLAMFTGATPTKSKLYFDKGLFLVLSEKLFLSQSKASHWDLRLENVASGSNEKKGKMCC